MNNKKSFKIEVSKNQLSIDAKDTTGYDVALAGVILTALLVLAYIIRKYR